jgi:hypothetical protein
MAKPWLFFALYAGGSNMDQLLDYLKSGWSIYLRLQRTLFVSKHTSLSIELLNNTKSDIIVDPEMHLFFNGLQSGKLHRP